MQQDGRWLMLKTNAATTEQPEALPIRAAAAQLGFMEAGGLDTVMLKNSAQQEAGPMPRFRILRL